MGKALRDYCGESLLKYGNENKNVVVFNVEVSSNLNMKLMGTMVVCQIFVMAYMSCIRRFCYYTKSS